MAANEGARADRFILGLSLLALVQLAILLVARGGPAGTGPTVEVGFDFSDVEVVEVIAGDSVITTLVSGEPTLVLVFHSSCPHCGVVAPTWARWLSDGRSKPAMIAVSAEPYRDALAYAERHDWDVPVRSAVVPLIGGQARSLVRLTPWVYGLDAEGRVVTTGHGSEIDRVAMELMKRTGS